MPKVVKKKKKGLAGGALARSSPGRFTSNLRPRTVTKNPPCIKGCPQGNDIRSFLRTIATIERYEKNADETYAEAWNILTKTNPLPAVCGRVCPHPCETGCNRKDKDTPVAINNVERFIGDYGIEKGLKHQVLDEKHPEKIAVVGAGPAGLGCAYHLARRGYSVTMLEAMPEAGGMLRYGIPAYRLPRNILDAEVKKILEMGVELKTNCQIGKDMKIDDLQREFNAVFVGTGAWKGYELRVGGEDAEGVYSGVEFLKRINSGETIDIGKKVAVVGGGDTAIDSARIAKRLGSDVTILYRRTRNEMPAIDPEVDETLEEGIDIQFLAAPVEVIKDGNRVKAIKAIRMELGEPDDSGRRRPVPIEDSEFEIELDTLIPAISQEPDFEGLEDLKSGPKDWIKADDNKFVKDNIYAGGDVLNLGLVTDALAHGAKAALSIHRKLRGIEALPEQEIPEITKDRIRLDLYEEKPRHEESLLPVSERFASLDIEIASTLKIEDIVEETNRCMSCGYCFDCEKCWEYCQDNAVIKGEKGEIYTYKDNLCTGCKKCMEECPCGYIDMV